MPLTRKRKPASAAVVIGGCPHRSQHNSADKRAEEAGAVNAAATGYVLKFQSI